MSAFLITVIVACAVIITIVVIMQPSKDSGMGGLSSGGVTDSVFGAGRNEFLTKATWWLMIIFLASSVALAKHQTRERLENDGRLKKKSSLEQNLGASSKTPEADSSKITTTTPDAAAKAVKDLLDKAEAEKKVDKTLKGESSEK